MLNTYKEEAIHKSNGKKKRKKDKKLLWLQEKDFLQNTKKKNEQNPFRVTGKREEKREFVISSVVHRLW